MEAERVYLELIDPEGNVWDAKLAADDPRGQPISIALSTDTSSIFIVESSGDGFTINAEVHVGSDAPQVLPVVAIQDPSNDSNFILTLSTNSTYTLFQADNVTSPNLPHGATEYHVIIEDSSYYMQVSDFSEGDSIFCSTSLEDEDSKQKWKFRSASGGQRHVIINTRQSE